MSRLARPKCCSLGVLLSSILKERCFTRFTGLASQFFMGLASFLFAGYSQATRVWTCIYLQQAFYYAGLFLAHMSQTHHSPVPCHGLA